MYGSTVAVLAYRRVALPSARPKVRAQSTASGQGVELGGTNRVEQDQIIDDVQTFAEAGFVGAA